MRQIIKIDKEKCNGCGLCVLSCAEGALQIIDGKAKLVSEKYCDGLAACLVECPQEALTIEQRVADDFDEEAVKLHLKKKHDEENPPCSCSSAMVTRFKRPATVEATPVETFSPPSTLNQWPVQLALVPPTAPFLQGADLLLTADCVPFAYAGFHRDLLKDHSLLVACPKLDDFQAHLQKLSSVLSQSDIRSLTVVHMEVPCCFGLVHMARQAVQLSGKDIPLKEITIGIKGDLKMGDGK
ncbi:MAG: 4Fe-4S binding protein [Chloroflexi bacterium]|nr:4Fe-4S binding protein [Chloroflexota bacterium]